MGTYNKHIFILWTALTWVEIKESVSLKIFMSSKAVKEYKFCNFHCNFFVTNEEIPVLPGWIKHSSLVGYIIW